jgi:hypothetical protein
MSIGFDNLGIEQTTALAFGASNRLTALFYSDPCATGGTSAFGGGVPTVDPDATNVLYLAQYDPGLGNLVNQAFSGPGAVAGEGLTIDGMGNIYIVGYFTMDVDVPVSIGGEIDITHHRTKGTLASFIVVFDATGDRKHTSIIQADGEVRLFAIAAADDGEFVVAGMYAGQLDAADGCPAPVGEKVSGAVIRKYSPGFIPLWTRCFADPQPVGDPALSSHARALGIALAADGTVVASGGFSRSIEIAGAPALIATTVPHEDDGDGIVIGWTPTGDYAWHRVCRSDAYDIAYDVAVGLDGHVVITGGVGDQKHCSDDGIPTDSQFTRAFVAAFDPSAPADEWLFERALDHGGGVSTTLSQFYDVEIEPCGELLVTGFADGVAQWDDSAGSFADIDGDSRADRDILAARLAADGTSIWERRISSSNEDIGLTIATDADGSVYLGGFYSADVDVEAWPAAMDCPNQNQNENAFLLHVSQ